MNTSSSEPQGSTREQYPTDLLSTHLRSTHWMSGMPLSYVLEMANEGLNNLSVPAPEQIAPESPECAPGDSF